MPKLPVSEVSLDISV